MYRFLFTASGMNPFYCESMAEAREYMQEYATKGHKNCQVWSLTDFMNCQDQFAEIPKEPDRVPEFVKVIEERRFNAECDLQEARAAVDAQLHNLFQNTPVVFRDTDAQIKQYSETGKTGTLPQNEGRKYDSGKLRFSLIPHDILIEVLHVLEFGAKKYGAHNWRMVENAKERYWDAAMRHLWEAAGEQLDHETKRRHEAHAICCLLFRGQLLIEEYRNDLRGERTEGSPQQDAYGEYQ